MSHVILPLYLFIILHFHLNNGTNKISIFSSLLDRVSLFAYFGQTVFGHPLSEMCFEFITPWLYNPSPRTPIYWCHVPTPSPFTLPYLLTWKVKVKLNHMWRKKKMIINFFELTHIKLKLLDNQPIGNNGIGIRLLVIRSIQIGSFLCELKNSVNFSNFFHFYYLFMALFFVF